MADTTTIRVGVGTKRVLEDLARQDDMSVQTEVARLVEMERRRRILDETDKSYDALHGDPEAWEGFQEERRLWENAVSDGVTGV